MEQCGYGFLEAVRNITGDLIMLRHLPAQTVRKLRLDAPVMVERTLVREGKEITVQMPMRERRYVQAVGNKQYYYKEFGSNREMHRETGQWLPERKGGKLPNPKDAEADTFDAPTNAVGPIRIAPYNVMQSIPSIDTKGVVPKLSLLPGADVPAATTTDVVAPAPTRHGDYRVRRGPRSDFGLLPAALDQRAPLRARLTQGRGIQPRILRRGRHPAHPHPAGGRAP